MTDSMTVTTTGLNEFKAMLAKLGAVGDAIAIDAMEAGARVVEIYAQNNVRTLLNKHPTGNLVNSIGVRREGKDVLVGVWGVVYAKIHEFGGVIVPIKAHALRFQIGGQWVTTKIVHMPARPYLRPAVNEHMPEINAAIAAAARGLIEKVWHG